MIKKFRKGIAVLTAALMLCGTFANTALAAPAETKALNEPAGSKNYVALNQYVEHVVDNIYKVTLKAGGSTVPQPLDIAIVLDASISMTSAMPDGKTRWEAAVEGARAAVDIFFDSSQNPSASLTQVSLITFGDLSGGHVLGAAPAGDAWLELPLTGVANKQDVTDGLDLLYTSIPNLSNFTAMNQGLLAADTELTTGRGARPGVTQYVIFLSDGIDNDTWVANPSGPNYSAVDTINTATDMKVTDGVTFMTIGVDIPGAANTSLITSSYDGVAGTWTDWKKASGFNEAQLLALAKAQSGVFDVQDFSDVTVSSTTSANPLYAYMTGTRGYFDIPGDQYGKDFSKPGTFHTTAGSAEGIQELIYMAQELNLTSVPSTPTTWGYSNPVLWGHLGSVMYAAPYNAYGIAAGFSPVQTTQIAGSTVNNGASAAYNTAKQVSTYEYNAVALAYQAATPVAVYTTSLSDMWGGALSTFTYDTGRTTTGIPAGEAGVWEASGYAYGLNVPIGPVPSSDNLYTGSYAGVYEGIHKDVLNSWYFDDVMFGGVPATGLGAVYANTDTDVSAWVLDEIEGPEAGTVVSDLYNVDTVLRTKTGEIRMPYFTPVTTASAIKSAFEEYAYAITLMGENVKVTAELNSRFTILENYNGMSGWYTTTGMSGQTASKSGSVLTWNMSAIPRLAQNTISYYVSFDTTGTQQGIWYYVNDIVYITYDDNPGGTYVSYCKYFPLVIIEGVSGKIELETTPAPTDYSTGLVGVYPYGTPATAYTPSVTPTPKTLASENLDEGAEDVDVTDDGDDDVDDGGDIDDGVADDEGEAVPATGNPVQNGALAVMISLAVVFAAAYLLRRRAKR